MDDMLWMPVPEYEGLYEVSEMGDVRSLPRTGADGRRVHGKMLKHGVNWAGYHSVVLQRDRQKKFFMVHRLVLASFVGPPPAGKPLALHGDGVRDNNHVSNLRWGNQSENMRDAIRHGTHPEASKLRCSQGHPFDEANTYRRPDGGRNCRECGKINARKYRKGK